MSDWTPIVISALAFFAMAGIAFAVGQYYFRSIQLGRRLPAPIGISPERGEAGSGIAGLVARHFDERRFGVDEATRGKLRLNLVQAGYFRRDAINFYVFWRLAAVVLLPLVTYILLQIATPDGPFATKFAATIVAAALGIIAPDAFISRKKGRQAAEYRIVFPDILDLLVVCIDAGLSLEGGLDRITGEIAKRSRNFGINLAVMQAEMRAGRSFIDALGSMADRLMIAEARSLVALLRQSIVLGSDIGDALRIFSNEMREKRMLRAEEQANKLAVKLVLPLALFIFPVVLGTIMLPIVIRMLALFHSGF